MDSGETHKLSYAPPKRLKREIRKKDLVVVVLFVMAAVVAWNWQELRRAYICTRAYVCQRRAMAESWDAKHLVYSETPRQAGSPETAPSFLFNEVQRDKAIYQSPAWVQMQQWRGIDMIRTSVRQDATVFLHSRATGSSKRLVIVELDTGDFVGHGGTRAIVMRGSSVVPGSPTRMWEMNKTSGGVSLDLELGERDRLKVFSGQVDPSDDSRFTIGFEVNGEGGVIDGQLLDGDLVTLKPREGVLVRDVGETLFNAWRLR
jgi:hypothetical protein